MGIGREKEIGGFGRRSRSEVVSVLGGWLDVEREGRGGIRFTAQCHFQGLSAFWQISYQYEEHQLTSSLLPTAPDNSQPILPIRPTGSRRREIGTLPLPLFITFTHNHRRVSKRAASQV